MSDKRESILVRLLEISKGIDGIQAAYRNKDEIGEKLRPAIVILDADEASNDGDNNRGRPFASLRRVTMTPEIYIILGGKPETVGTDINALRSKLIKAILTDTTLAGIVGTSGGMSYEGCITSLARGRTMEGECSILFSFTYILNPSELAA